MRWWWVALALAGCNSNRDAPAASQPTTETRETPVAAIAIDAAVPAQAPGPSAVALPDAVGLPAPFERLRPFMRRREAEAVLSSLSLTTAWPAELGLSPSESVYAVSNGVYATISFDGERLVSITLHSVPETLLAVPARAKWGPGTPDPSRADGFLYKSAERWPPTAAGWTTELLIGPGELLFDAYKRQTYQARLELTASDPVAAEKPAADAVATPSFAAIGKLLGQPMTGASKLFGDTLRLETDDDQDEDAAEAETTQGYARVKFDWMDAYWEITIRTDKKSQRIDHIVLAGEAAEYAEQFALMKNLEAAFGPRRAMIDEVGDLLIGFGSGAIDARAQKDGDRWEIELRR